MNKQKLFQFYVLYSVMVMFACTLGVLSIFAHNIFTDEKVSMVYTNALGEHWIETIMFFSAIPGTLYVMRNSILSLRDRGVVFANE